MEHWMLTHELNVCRHRELLREAQGERLARRVVEVRHLGSGRLTMVLSLVAILVTILVRG